MERDRVCQRVIIFIGIVLVLAILKIGASVAIPLAVAMFVFMLVSPLMERLIRHGMPKILAIAIVLILTTLFCLCFVYTIIAMINVLLAELPSYINKVTVFDAYISGWIRGVFNIEESEFPSIITMLNIDWAQQVKNILSSLSSASASIVGDMAMVIVYLLFLLMEEPTIFPKINAAFPKTRNEASELVKNISHQTSRYLIVKILISLVTGVCFYLVAILSGMDFPLVWGVLACLLNFIPTIGSIVVTVLGTLMAAIQFMPHWGRVGLVFLGFLATEMILGNIIDPKMQGEQLNMSPFVILIMLAIWGYIWGIAGMFLAVPIACVIQVVCATIPSLKPAAILLSSGSNLEEE